MCVALASAMTAPPCILRSIDLVAAHTAHNVCLFQPTVIVLRAHWEAYGRGSLPLQNLVSDSAHPHYVSDPPPRHCGIIVALDSSEP